MKQFILLSLFCLFFGFESQAQRVGLNFLFQPHLTVGATYVPNQNVEDSLRFGLQRIYANTVIPLNGKLSLDIDDFDASFSQHFLTLNTGLRRPTGNLVQENSQLYNLSLGITGVHASLQKGVWFYTLNGGVVQDIELLSESSLFGTAALAWVSVKGIYKHNIYGIALLYQYKRLLPVPIIGFNRRYNKNWFLEVLLPAQAALRYRFSKKLKAGAMLSLGSFRAGVQPSEQVRSIGLELQNQLNLNYTEIKITGVGEYNISKRMLLSAQLGLSSLRRLYFLNADEEQESFDAEFVPYVGAALQIDLKKSLISSRLFGNDF